MSVTFCDPMNPTEYDNEYNIVGGGREVNVSNGNAYDILNALQIPSEDLYGSLSGSEFRALCNRAIIRMTNTRAGRLMNEPIPSSVDAHPEHATLVNVGRDRNYLLNRVQELLEAFKDSEEVCWG